jgi:hypothetical protein
VVDDEADADRAQLDACLNVLAAHGLTAVPTERRRSAGGLPGGTRAADNDLTLRACADWVPCDIGKLRRAARSGELPTTSQDGPGGRKEYHVTLAAWTLFLKRRGWVPDRVPLLEAVLARQLRFPTL